MDRLGLDVAEAPLATGIGRQGRVELTFVEIRPQAVGEIQLRVGDLP
jgi:hypothetical protein